MSSAHDISLADNNPLWPEHYRREAQRIAELTGIDVRDVEHIGSTAIPGMIAKPYVDMLIGVASVDDLDGAQLAITGIGYVAEGARSEHRWLCYPTPTSRQFIAHVVVKDGSIWRARIRFRDELRSSSELRDAYTLLKHELAEVHPNDLSAYTHGKRSFVESVLRRHAT